MNSLDRVSRQGVFWQPETKKPPGKAVSSKVQSVWEPTSPGNGSVREAATKSPNQFSGHSAIQSSFSRNSTRYRRPPPLALCRTRTDCEAWVCCRVGCGGRAEWGVLTHRPACDRASQPPRTRNPGALAPVERNSHTRHHSKNAWRPGQQVGAKASAAGRDVSLERVRGSSRKLSR